MKLAANLISAAGLEAAASAAATRGNDFFPSRIGFRAAQTSAEYQASLLRRWTSGFQIERPEFVVVPKGGGGTRPGCDFDVASRLLFDSLNAVIREAIEPDLVNWSLVGDARAKAEDELQNGTHTHVLVTDVVAFYEYIDREVLRGELADLSGLDDAVDALMELLEVVMPRAVGIPQGSPSAGLLADVYLSIVDRVLARADVGVTRWADDYRFPAASLRSAFRIRTTLEQALRQLGLVVSSAKTWTPTKETYATWVAAQRAERTRIAEVKARIEERRTEDYAAEDDDGADLVPGPGDPDLALQERFEVDTADGAPWGSSPDAYATGRRIQVSLAELGRTGSTLPLDRLSLLLYRFPHLTKQIAMYLRARIRGGWEEDTVNVIAETLRDRNVPHEWQIGWLLHALIPSEFELPRIAVDFATSEFYASTAASFTRGRAALVLGREGKLPRGADLAAVFDQVSEASKADLVAAAMCMPDDADLRKFSQAVRRDPLLRTVADSAADTNEYLL